MAIHDYKIKYYKSSIENKVFTNLKNNVLEYISKSKKNFYSPFSDSDLKSDYPQTKMPNLKPFYQIIQEHLIKYLNTNYINLDTLQVGNLWINITDKDEFQYYHNHDTFNTSIRLGIRQTFYSIFSGSIYIQVPNNSGNFTLINEDLYNPFEITPKEGEIFLFPSYLRHGVMPNKSDESRISISFNLNVEDRNTPWPPFEIPKIGKSMS